MSRHQSLELAGSTQWRVVLVVLGEQLGCLREEHGSTQHHHLIAGAVPTSPAASAGGNQSGQCCVAAAYPAVGSTSAR